MQDKFQVEVFLALSSVDVHQRGKTEFLVVKHNDRVVFPSGFLTKDITTKDIALNLLKAYSGVTSDWATVFPFGVIDQIDKDKESISILYGVFIPGITRIRKENSMWIQYQALESDANVPEFTKKIAYETIWRPV